MLKRMSIGIKLNMLVLLIWLIPAISVVYVTSSLISDSIRQELLLRVQVSATQAVNTLSIQLDQLITLSRRASYDKQLQTAKSNFESNHDTIQLHEDVTAYLEQIYNYNDKIYTTIAFYPDAPDRIYYRINYTVNTNYDALKYYINQVHPLAQSYGQTNETDVRLLRDGDHIYMMRNVLNASFKTEAVLVLELNQAMFSEAFSTIQWYIQADVRMQGITLIEPSGDMPAMHDFLKRLPNGVKSDSSASLESRVFYYGQSPIDSHLLTYEIEIDYEAIHVELQKFRSMFIVMAALFIVAMLILMIFIRIEIQRPIDKLVDLSNCIAGGDYGVKIREVLPNKEFAALTHSINDMSIALKKQIDKIYSEEINVRDARLHALQSQINPHFLNNTLEIINWEARMVDNESIPEMIEKLSIMLDAAMDRGNKPYVSLAEELQYVNAYLFIIAKRMGKRLSIVQEIDESTLSIQVPKLIVQPIIENAIEHGVALQHGSGVLRICIWRTEEELLISVENNGQLSGENKMRIDSILEGRPLDSQENYINIGIFNVHQRLKLVYGTHAKLEITNIDEQTVAARLHIPLSEILFDEDGKLQKNN